MLKMNFLCPMAAAVILCCVASTSADLLTNGSFEQIRDPNENPTHFNGIQGGNSAATGWTVWHNTNGSTSTQVMSYFEAGLPDSDASKQGENLIHVETSHAGNGLVQAFLLPNTGPNQVVGEAYIWVQSGIVGVGIGNGGNTQYTDFTDPGLNGIAWQKMNFGNAQSPANEIIFYAAPSATGGSAEFYVDLASVSAIPEPASFGLLSAGLLGMVVRRRR